MASIWKVDNGHRAPIVNISNCGLHERKKRRKKNKQKNQQSDMFTKSSKVTVLRFTYLLTIEFTEEFVFSKVQQEIISTLWIANKIQWKLDANIEKNVEKLIFGIRTMEPTGSRQPTADIPDTDSSIFLLQAFLMMVKIYWICIVLIRFERSEKTISFQKYFTFMRYNNTYTW